MLLFTSLHFCSTNHNVCVRGTLNQTKRACPNTQRLGLGPANARLLTGPLLLTQVTEERASVRQWGKYSSTQNQKLTLPCPHQQQ